MLEKFSHVNMPENRFANSKGNNKISPDTYIALGCQLPNGKAIKSLVPSSMLLTYDST